MSVLANKERAFYFTSLVYGFLFFCLFGQRQLQGRKRESQRCSRLVPQNQPCTRRASIASTY